MEKKILLPKWMMKRIPMGKEQEELAAMAVPMFFLMIVVIVMLWYNFFQGDWLLWTLGTLVALILCIVVYYEFAIQISLLEKAREKVNSDYVSSNDEREKEELKKKLTDLCVSVGGLKNPGSLLTFQVFFYFLNYKKEPIGSYKYRCVWYYN